MRLFIDSDIVLEPKEMRPAQLDALTDFVDFTSKEYGIHYSEGDARLVITAQKVVLEECYMNDFLSELFFMCSGELGITYSYLGMGVMDMTMHIRSIA